MTDVSLRKQESAVMEQREVSPIRSGTQTASIIAVEDFANLAAQEGDGRLFKMEVDYTSQVDEALPKADAIAKTGNVAAALESLSSLEKQTRLGSDMKSNSRIVQHMVKLCFEGSAWTLLNDTIVTLSKKRSIIKLAIARMVRDCCDMIEQMPNEQTKSKLIENLRNVTAGKIYVEVERARLTSRLVKKLESEGKIDEAAAMLLELQVETYGSMEMKEKVEFLLEQMRLCVLRKDFVRESIICKKISVRFFEDKSEAIQELKLKYYDLMIKLGLNGNAYLDVCRYYRQVYDTPRIQADPEKTKQVLKCVVLYVLLSPHTNEQWDLLHRIHQMRQLELIPEYNLLLELFINEEIIFWKDTILTGFEALLRRGTATSPATDVFETTENGNKRWTDLQTRVGEHNMRMVAKYYTQITFDRMAELLDYRVEEMEKFLCNMIVTGAIPDAKIHRPLRVVNLRARKANIEQLDQWASSVRKLTDILNKVSHLILKEEMVHRHLDAKIGSPSQ
ncbi:26S proteasome non-ATPase regulatory subunit 12 [Toxocara canis]|uniref:26S proteasome non-ATPase regulatory subunit 12 n=1 Tax=Toxocara canis TaxID=6265 RepID=A0A0B2V283_TOXCA|nr:26S proteasome non-ATPase regulatory subunit 12 [Toxocara canis]